jgi:predicted hydrocarbon binding protein
VHGFIFSEIREFVSSALGPAAWGTLLKKAGLGSRNYERFLEYPDAEAVALVTTASEVTGQPPAAILESFGRFLGPHLLKVYRPLIDPGWKTLDFLENTEQTIHEVVRARNRQAKPPALRWERTSPEEAVLTYRSPRKMCPLAKGITMGVAEAYGEAVDIDETTCMHRGDAACTMRVRVTEAPAAS